MYSETDIEAAVAAGVMTPDAAAALRNYVSSERSAPSVDEEHFRLITGFNDIFVSIAAAILLFAVAWIGQSIGPKIGGDGPSPFAGLFVAATAWGLAEFFTRKRRMALPSILLLLAFVAGVLLTVFTTIVLGVGEEMLEDNERAAALVIAASAAIAAGATYFHWKRFRVPITIAVGAATVVGVVMALIAYAVGDPDNKSMENVLLGSALVLGLGVFLFAMRWDSSDPRRETRRSDVAFWLHLLAAPLIVHPIFTLLGLNDGDATIGEAMVVLLVYLLLGLTALAVDRRALLVSALAYVLFALISLFRQFGAVELNIALAALVIGSGLLLLSAFWHSVRKSVVRPLPAGLQSRLPVLDRPAAHAAA
jgi:drug/metabolite transporter (DMT)-like permease